MQIEKDIIRQNEKKGAKTATIIGILIAITIIVVIAITFLILSRSGKKFSVVINGQATNVPEDTFIITDEGKVYVSIRDIAPFLGYEAHNGEYKVDIEDKNKMYVEAIDGTETASFYLNSTTISKVAPNTNDDYENIAIKEPVNIVNDKMYVIDDGIRYGFNVLMSYNQDKNQVTINTLPNLLKFYETKIAEYGYSKISEDFINQKALVYGMIVASKENTEKFGVIDTQGNEILSPRYNKIEFVESTGEFIITNSSEKVGIAYSDGKTKITVAYDEIKVMDSKLGLYLVNSNKKYGVIDSSERSIIYIEYDQIGVDVAKFPNDNIKNQYILYDTMIPAKINGKWRLFDISGKRINEKEYDNLGFVSTNSSDKVNGNALTIGETKTVVVGNNELYGGVDVKGNELIPLRFEKIYSTTSAGKTTYYILHNGKDYSATDYIDVMKKQLGYEKDTTINNNINHNTEGGHENSSEQNRNEVQNQATTNEVNNEVSNSIETSSNVVDTNGTHIVEESNTINDANTVDPTEIPTVSNQTQV